MKRIALLSVFTVLMGVTQVNGQFNWPDQGLTQPVAGEMLSPWPVPQSLSPTSTLSQYNSGMGLPTSQPFQFASGESRRSQQVALSSWDQLPIHKHALVQAEMTRNGDGAIWRTRLDRPNSQGRVDVMDTRNFTLLDYRKMFREARTPAPQELIGQWRGVNKGIVNLVGYNQFIKEVAATPCDIRGDNIKVEQVSNDLLRSIGWAPVAGMPEEGYVSREGFFQVRPPKGKGFFKHGATFSYRHGQNKITDPVRLLVDKVVVLDRNHLLGRVTANFGVVQIPLSYFTLERVR